MSQWQSIATAPNDGRFIWLSDGFFMRIATWKDGHWVDMVRDAQAKIGGGATGITFEPRYWQHLPNPPEER